MNVAHFNTISTKTWPTLTNGRQWMHPFFHKGSIMNGTNFDTGSTINGINFDTGSTMNVTHEKRCLL